MSGYTHAAVGANAIWLAALVGQVDPLAGALMAVGAFAGLLPDIDSIYAKVQFLFGGLLRPFRVQGSGLWQHRGIVHSFFATAIVFIVSWIFLRQYHPLFPYVAALGYASHLIIDGFNTTVGYFFPFTRTRTTFWPRALWVKVGGHVDQLFFFLAMISLIFFFLAYKDQIWGLFPQAQSAANNIQYQAQ